jgi:site-specific recombinase XerC
MHIVLSRLIVIGLFAFSGSIRVVQELMGHSSVKTTEIYTHVMEKDISVVLSPLDHLTRKNNNNEQ